MVRESELVIKHHTRVSHELKVGSARETQTEHLIGHTEHLRNRFDREKTLNKLKNLNRCLDQVSLTRLTGICWKTVMCRRDALYRRWSWYWHNLKRKKEKVKTSPWMSLTSDLSPGEKWVLITWPQIRVNTVRHRNGRSLLVQKKQKKRIESVIKHITEI